MTKRMNFTGKGFSKEPLTEDELAEHRERAHHYDRHFLSVDVFLEQAGLRWLSNVAKGFPAFLKFALTAGAIAGAYVALIKAGWL